MSEFNMVIIGLFVCGIIGGFLGSSGNRAFLGFMLSFLFGPIGWGLILFDINYHPACPKCKEHINKGAVICPHCGSDLRKP